MQTNVFTIYNQNNKTVNDAYSMLATNLFLENKSGEIKSVALCSCKPGVGKTTMAINLAVTMARPDFKVLLVDADMRKPFSAKKLNADSIFGLSDCLSGDVWLDEAICRTNIENLDYLPSGESASNPVSLFSFSRYEELVTYMKGKYDFIIFDTSTLFTVADGAAIAARTDGVILVAQIGRTSLITMKKAKKYLEKADIKILGVVLNKVKKRDYKNNLELYDYSSDVKKFKNKKKPSIVGEFSFVGKQLKE
jgi:capsular exopolysaccharide synthesis family protein